MVQKSQSQPPGMMLKTLVNHGINDRPQLVSKGVISPGTHFIFRPFDRG